MSTTAEERLKILADVHKKAPQLKALPQLPTPVGYSDHKTVQVQMGVETISPMAAVRGPDWMNRSGLAGLTQQEKIRLAADRRVCCWVASCASHALSTNAPLIHVTTDLAQAFADTDPSAEPSDYRMPYPAFILNLPKDLVKNADGGFFNFILISSIPEVKGWWDGLGLPFSHWGLGNPQADDFYLCGYSLENGVQYLPVKWQDVVRVCRGAFDDGRSHDWVAPDLSDQCDFSTLCRIACNAILAMNHSPDLFYEEAVEVRRNSGFGKDSTYKGSIRWLGKAYRRNKGVAEAGSTGKIYRPHWRRGHWHTVLHGARRALRKLQWFQPTYVNGDPA